LLTRERLGAGEIVALEVGPRSIREQILISQKVAIRFSHLWKQHIETGVLGSAPSTTIQMHLSHPDVVNPLVYILTNYRGPETLHKSTKQLSAQDKNIRDLDLRPCSKWETLIAVAALFDVILSLSDIVDIATSKRLVFLLKEDTGTAQSITCKIVSSIWQIPEQTHMDRLKI